MSKTVKEKLEERPLFDSAIIEHHFTSYMRDYDILVDVPAVKPNGDGSYLAARCQYRFTHCVLAQVTTVLTDGNWRTSWSDKLIDYEIWEQSGKLNGFVWGVGWQLAYPGLSYIENSDSAREWSTRLSQQMHEAIIETNCQMIKLIFHDVNIREIARDNPDTNELTMS